MRKVIYGGACSLDGFLTGPGGALDWLHFSKDVKAVMQKTWATADTILFGRKTWAGAAGSGSGGGGMAGVTSYLFSRTLTEVPPGGPVLVRDDAGAFVRRLKSEPGKDIVVMSGGDLARSLFAAGVIDEVGLNIHPVLLGSGTPAFLDAGSRIGLELIECRTLDGGCILATWRVPSAASPGPTASSAPKATAGRGRRGSR
jgi:dihydrofolate reductase